MLSAHEQIALQRISGLLSAAADPWWVLGSAAMALIGVDPGEIRDIDVLVSRRDATALMDSHHWENQADGGTEQFRSSIFLRPGLGEKRVEIMSEYEIRRGDKWEPVQPASRLRVMLDDTALFVPERWEQIEILNRLARPKDRERISRFV